jgi:ABC-type branched-subunit amino acid transport system substrate-binding protein
VTLIYCNDKNDPNTTVTCARQMTSSHVIAIVGSGGGLSGNLAAGILGKAGIAELGINPVTTPEFNDSNVFLFSGGTAVSYPLISAYSSKVKLPTSVALAQNPDGEAISAGMAQVAKQAGLPFVAQVPVPATAADFSPLVGAAKPGTAKGLILELGYEQDAAFIHAAKGQGVSFTYLNSQEPDQGVSQALGTAGLNKYIYASPFPPLNPSSSHPIIAQFFTALKAMGSTDQANMVSQYPSYSAFSGYLAVQELDNLAKAGTIKSLTASGVMAGLKSITKVNVFGVLPAWDPNTPGPKGISRAGNPFYYINGYNNGTPRQILPTTVSTTGLVAGKGLTPSVIASHGL